MKEELQRAEATKAKDEASTCIALGAGVGILGAVSAALTGAVCPLCIFVAPGLIGYGAYKKWVSPNPEENGDENRKPQL